MASHFSAKCARENEPDLSQSSLGLVITKVLLEKRRFEGRAVANERVLPGAIIDRDLEGIEGS